MNLPTEPSGRAHLGILDGIEGVYLAKVEPQQPIRLNSWEGAENIPALFVHPKNPSGLAAGRRDRFHNRQDEPDQEHTPNTIADPEELKAHLALILERGWALDDEENEPHIRCVGAPVRNIDGRVLAAISLSGLAAQADEARIGELAGIVMAAADRLSAALGNGYGSAEAAGGNR